MKPNPRFLWLAAALLAACPAGGSKGEIRAIPTGDGGAGPDQGSSQTTEPDGKRHGPPIVSGAPDPRAPSPGDKPTPKPTTPEDRALERLAKPLTTRVQPHLEVPADQLHGVRLLASAPPTAPPLDALLVQVFAQPGQLETFVLLLDGDDSLIARLPRALPDGPHALRIGALSIPLNAPHTWRGIAAGEVDPAVAGAVLRLGAMVARDHLLAAAEKGWGQGEQNHDLDVLVLGVQPDSISLPGEVPAGAPIGVPETFSVGKSMTATLEGWSTQGNTWRGIARIPVITAEGTSLILRIGLQGRLP